MGKIFGLPLQVTPAVLCLLMVFSATCTSAQRSLECQTVWEGPDPSNDVLGCLGDTSRIASQWRYYLFPGFAVLVLVALLVGGPIMWCCVCCSCCTPRKPGTRQRARRCTWVWVILALLASIAVCVLVIFGVNRLMKSLPETLDNVRSGPMFYVTNTKDRVVDLLGDLNETAGSPAGIDLSSFDRAINDLNDVITTARDGVMKYADIIAIVLYCVGGAVVFFVLVLLLFTACRCTGCCVCASSGVYYLFGIIFGLLAVVFTLFMYVIFAGCGELALQHRREPGISQWYLVPTVEEKLDFREITDKVRNEEERLSKAGCEKLLEHCDGSPEYDGTTNRERVFVCGAGLTTGGSCTSFMELSAALDSSYLKPVLSATLCNSFASATSEVCTPAVCAEHCVEGPGPAGKAKEIARQMVDAAAIAAIASEALGLVRELLDVNFVVDCLVSVAEVGSNGSSCSAISHSTCADIKKSSILLAAGFFIGTLLFFLCLYVIARGQCVWGRDKHDPVSESFSPAPDYQPRNICHPSSSFRGDDVADQPAS